MLRLFNLVDFFSKPWWPTTAAVREETYPDFAGPAAPEATLSADWEQAFEEADACVQSLLGQVAVLGAPPPDAFGFELTDPSARVVGKAESAWTYSKLALLGEDQRSCAAPNEAAGWRAFDEGVEAGDIRVALAAKID